MDGSGFDEACIRCDNTSAVDELGYCGHCRWEVFEETELGFYQLREYLHSWALYRDYCAKAGQSP